MSKRLDISNFYLDPAPPLKCMNIKPKVTNVIYIIPIPEENNKHTHKKKKTYYQTCHQPQNKLPTSMALQYLHQIKNL